MPIIVAKVSESGKTQAVIARAVGISEAYMSQIVNGDRVPHTPVALAIAKELNSTVEELFGEALPADGGEDEGR